MLTTVFARRLAYSVTWHSVLGIYDSREYMNNGHPRFPKKEINSWNSRFPVSEKIYIMRIPVS